MKNLRKKIGIFLMLIMVVCMLSAHADVSAASAKISIDKTKYVLPKGSRIKLHATILKSKYAKRKIRWSSSKKSVAKVSKSGTVLAKKKGTATITARISGTKYKVSCKIYVGTPVTAITVPKNSCKIEVGKTYSIGAQVLPSSATVKSISYTSSDSTIAKVESGIVKGKKAGTAIITMVSKDGHEVSNTFTVHVIEAKKTDETDDQAGQNSGDSTEGQNTESSGSDHGDSSEDSETDTISETVRTFLQYMEEYSAFIKQNASLIQKSGSGDTYTYDKAKTLVAAGNVVKVNCTSPMNWGLHQLGLLSDTKNIYGGKDGFSTHATALTQAGTFYKTGDFIGMGLPQAAKAGYLQPGDMVAIYISSSTPNHSVVYAGLDESQHPLVYEAGGIAESRGYSKVGCGPLDYNSNTGYKITEIYRLN